MNSILITSDASVCPKRQGDPGGPAAWAAQVGNQFYHGSITYATINFAELVAIRNAIALVPPGYDTVTVWTDSKNAVGWLTGSLQAHDDAILKAVRDIKRIAENRGLDVTYEYRSDNEPLLKKCHLMARMLARQGRSKERGAVSAKGKGGLQIIK